MWKPPDGEPALPPPSGLRTALLEADGERFLIISYPQDRWLLPSALTSAQRDVACAVLEGKTRREVARERGTSTRTVANLLAQAFRRLGVSSRAELAAMLNRAKDAQTP